MSEASDGAGLKRRHVLAALAAVGLGGVIGTNADRPRRPYRAPDLAPVPLKDGAARRPNILLIMSDQERHWLDLPQGLGLHAHERLLETGIGFSNNHANTTPCSPSRSNSYFGQHTQHTRMTVNIDAPPTFARLADGLPSIGHLLRAQGYYTAYKGKWHLSHMRTDPGLTYGPYPSTRDALEPFGFADYNIDGDPHGSTWTGYRYDAQIASTAANWLATRGRNLRGEKPWFLAVNFVNPHDVMYFSSGEKQEKTRISRDVLSPIAPPPVGDPYDKVWDLPLPASFYRDDAAGKLWSQRTYIDLCNWLYGDLAPDDEAAWRAYQSYYFNCIRDVDRHVLSLLRALDELGLSDNTIVVYTADHGEMAGAHKLRQKGPFMYKENVRVPLIIRHPDVAGGSSTDALASAIDLAPTLLSLAGADPAQVATAYPFLKGVDLAPAMARPSARTARDERGILFNYGTPLYIDPEFTRKGLTLNMGVSARAVLISALKFGQVSPTLDQPGLFRGIHDGRYKFARYFKPSEHHVPRDWATLLRHNELELYDLAQDPDEISNLAASPEMHKDLILSLNERLNRLIAEEVGPDLGSEFPGPGFLYRLRGVS